MSARTVYVVPHTHWDREWYQPLELFRWRLVQMIDDLLEHMESHPEYECFTLDGQSIVIDDYLELRPENESRLRGLIEAGRIVIGPWWVQPDEFLPTGESHIRNFQRGIRFAERLGGSLSVGHCADQFGHIAQMPQIMKGLGLTSVCLWRGVPDSVPGWSFWWEAPDGTRLPVLYLRNSYSNGWRLPQDPAGLRARVAREKDARRPDEPFLLMNGTDHSRIEKHVPAALREADDGGHRFRLATVAGYERAMLAAGIDEWVHEGELRSPDRSNVLVGVLSARMSLKQRDFQVQSLIERTAEPLELLAHLRAGYDGLPALEQAWRLMLENAPHDSICGCSVDQTHREMLPRYDRAEQLAGEVTRQAMTALLIGEAHGSSEEAIEQTNDSRLVPGVAVFRNVPHSATVLEASVPADWEGSVLIGPAGEAVSAVLGPAGEDEVLLRNETTPEGALRHLDFLREGRFADQRIEEQRWWAEGSRLQVETLVGPGIQVGDAAGLRAELRSAVEGSRFEAAVVTARRRARRTLRAVLPASDTVGLETWQLTAREAPSSVAASRGGPSPAAKATSADRAGISNEFFRITPGRAGIDVEEISTGRRFEGLNQLIDEGDRGDEYNADILDEGAVLSPAPELLAAGSDGVSARLLCRVVFRVPRALTGDRRRRQSRFVPLEAEVEAIAWAGLPRVDFRVRLENRARDHRLRALFPLGFETEEAITEGHFHVQRRSLAPLQWNGRSAERPPRTFPQKSFAAFEAEGRGVAILNRGLPEGEVVTGPEGPTYALTLLRCVGWLSRDDLLSRRGHAGPHLATVGSQMVGEHEFAYAWTCYRGGWQEAGVLPLAHGYAHEPAVFATNLAGPGRLPLASFPEQRLVPSALHRSAASGGAVVRAWNAGPSMLETVPEMLATKEPGARVDLMEREVEVSGSGALSPWEIASWAF
ncbi:MAG: hypothetical protein ACE5EF_02110 [Dehalococcoidia bacterium]